MHTPRALSADMLMKKLTMLSGISHHQLCPLACLQGGAMNFLLSWCHFSCSSHINLFCFFWCFLLFFSFFFHFNSSSYAKALAKAFKSAASAVQSVSNSCLFASSQAIWATGQSSSIPKAWGALKVMMILSILSTSISV